MKSNIQNAINTYEKYKWWFWFVMGLVAVFVFLFPYFYLRENAYFMIHDELDDGIFKYMLNAKHFGDGTDFIPEFMGGQSKSSVVVSSLWGIILYKIMSPYNAFLTMMTISVVTGYIGVFLLGKELSDNAFASFFAASVFSYLPFRSMFALNIVGFPIFIWAVIKLAKGKGKKIIVPLLVIIYYASGITMVCGGYIAIGFLGVSIVILAIIKIICKKRRKEWVSNVSIINVIIAEVILSFIQILLSLDLIKNTFINNTYISHRDEMDPSIRSDYIKHFFQMMHFGGSHAECCSWIISIVGIALICIIPLIYLLFLQNKDNKYSAQKWKYFLLCGLYLANVFNALFSCIWMSVPVVSLRESIGGVFRTFQFDRTCWIMPTCWMCILILEISLLLDITASILKCSNKIKSLLAIIPIALVVATMVIYSKNVYLSSVFYHNARLLAFPNTYHVDTWREYFAEDLFEDIKLAIGKEQSEYRVVSVAFNPAVTLYNGFYTLDGYSTDYPLEYKHRFRKIIEGELNKDEGISYYFDRWGSRCYIFCSEIPLSTGLNNCSNIINELSIDTEALKDMGADYIFSNSEILNSEELKLSPISGSPFVNESLKYKIWVYEIR